MSERTNPAALPLTRRQIAGGIAMAFCSMAAHSGAFAEQSMKQMPGSAASQQRTSLHEEIDIKSGPQRIYEALLDAKQFAAFSGAPAEIYHLKMAGKRNWGRLDEVVAKIEAYLKTARTDSKEFPIREPKK